MHIDIDTREVACKLSFLVGKVILFREVVDESSDYTTATNVLSVRVENTPGTEGYPIVHLYTSVGIRHITHSREFKDIMVLEPDGLKCLGDYADDMGICF